MEVSIFISVLILWQLLEMLVERTTLTQKNFVFISQPWIFKP